MIPSLDELLDQILNGTLLPAAAIARWTMTRSSMRATAMHSYESDWLRCHKEIERRWSEATVDPDTARLAEDIRRESFLTVSRATTQHEIASYVSDDFDLIVKAAILGFDDPFLSTMWDAYARNEIPAPAAEP